MSALENPVQPLRVRIFVDFWNFSLSLRRQDDAFKVDWRPVASLIVSEASRLLGQSAIYEAMHIYGSYDPAKPADGKFKNWFLNWLDRLPGVQAILLERQKKRNYAKCPSCHEENRNCCICGADLRGTEEKGVDTRIATDMVSLAWSNGYDVAVIISADRDFVPVANFLQSKGIKVIHGSFPPTGAHLSRQCWANFSIIGIMDRFRLPNT
ncbi:MAG: NYN domain-containing protein [Sphingopyxis sp.]|nr:NYN domain-containing protein [Sphingopyxis sp.]